MPQRSQTRCATRLRYTPMSQAERLPSVFCAGLQAPRADQLNITALRG